MHLHTIQTLLVPVGPAEPPRCVNHGEAVPATVPETGNPGYLSTIVSVRTGVGIDCPWRLQAGSGQRVNLTVFNFHQLDSPREIRERERGGTVWSEERCYELGTIRDGPDTRRLTVCGGVRESNRYLSNSHAIEIHFLPAAKLRKLGPLLVGYEGKLSIIGRL